MGNVTQIIQELRNGDLAAADRLFAAVYDELRRLAARKVARERPGQTLQSTALVYEAYLRLLGDEGTIWENRAHFFAGATDTGRPYFVMDLVKGIPITEYCDQNKLSTRHRLELFISVCHAIQHAHHKGVIHRDIKPNNILVTLHDSVPVPKVIDFGIAKATSQRLTEKTLFTESRQFIGTPEYMSPDQAGISGLDVDTRTDIYSLGVLLYELLTGTTPFDGNTLRKVSYAEIQRIIREEEPPKPSTRVNTLIGQGTDIASQRQIEPATLSKIFRGDLDWIVMKAMEKDRTRRYETANDFARDVQRHLNDEPVLAGPPSPVYKLRKFVRRRRAVGIRRGCAPRAAGFSPRGVDEVVMKTDNLSVAFLAGLFGAVCEQPHDLEAIP